LELVTQWLMAVAFNTNLKMQNFISQLCMFVILISVITFAIGFLMLFFEEKRKLGLKMLLYSVIAIIIGFGTCVATADWQNYI